ncbi:MAG: hypothetical protein JJE39_07265 [Vicinamibacteria bacterium]|nr:hypothetical protein [Vicinamibacteria bacterium]
MRESATTSDTAPLAGVLAPRLLTVCSILLRRSSLRLPAIDTVSNVSRRFLMNNPG